ncbi:MAG: CaiB/BaiF CoA transferase family protein [Arenicellales bacterium WSBS_2016_MAG_OTU3]
MVGEKSGPLAGLTVLELSHIMAGPVCGLMLADMGADVVKVEKIPGGDDTRRMTPPNIGEESAAFLMMNRNKRGVAINLKHEDGKDVFKKLVSNCDVLIENYRKGTMEKLGLGYDDLQKINPGLICCEISGFGRTGPYANRAGFDLIAQAMSGLMSITGARPDDSNNEQAPMKCGAPITDITAGILGAMGVLAAYINRLKTGKGQRVDTSLFESGIVHTYWQSAMAFATGNAPGAMGSAHPLNAPYQAFPTKDGWITVGAANQTNWLKMLNVLNISQLANDRQFVDNAARMKNLSKLEETLEPIFKTRRTQDWLKRFEEAGVPAGPINSVIDMQQDEQTLARDMVVDLPHTLLGTSKAIGHPVKYSATPVDIQRGAPVYGEHTREVLLELGYSDEEINKLAAANAIAVT